MSRQRICFPENMERSVQVDMIDGQFDLTDETLQFMRLVREKIAAVASELEKDNTVMMDEETHRAAVRALQHAKNLYCDAAIIGGEVGNRRAKMLKQKN